MSTKRYSSSERGGGAGDTGRMRAAILNQLSTWWGKAKWEDPERAERLFDKISEAPERFINPNPDTCGSYREEASRIYDEIKREHGLRTKGDLARVQRDYREKAERYVEKQQREAGDEAPEPRGDGVETGFAPAEEPAEPGATGLPAPDEIGDTGQEIEAEPAEPTEPAPTSDPTPFPVLLGQVVGFGLRSTLSGGWGALRQLVAWLLPILAVATKRSAFLSGRAVGVALRYSVAVALVSVSVGLAFSAGFAGALLGVERGDTGSAN